MAQTERSGRQSVSPCFHPEHEQDLSLHLDLTATDARELEPLRAIGGSGHPCFHPEHEQDLSLHLDLTATDARELATLNAASRAGGSVAD